MEMSEIPIFTMLNPLFLDQFYFPYKKIKIISSNTKYEYIIHKHIGFDFIKSKNVKLCFYGGRVSREDKNESKTGEKMKKINFVSLPSHRNSTDRPILKI